MENIILKRVINSLTNDIRLQSYTGKIIPYIQYSYEKIFSDKYQEVLNEGYKISILINEKEFIPNYITLYIWTNEFFNKIYIKESIKEEIIELQTKNVIEIKKVIMMLLFNNEIKHINNLNIGFERW